MPLDQSFAGRTYPAHERYEVGLEKIREFAAAIGDDNPVYRDPEAARAAGHPTVIAPPTFLTIINLRTIHEIVDDPELGLDWDRVVQGEQRFVHHRPVRAGDSLAIEATIENVMNRAGHGFLTVRGDVSDAAGEPVCTVTATVVVRGNE